MSDLSAARARYVELIAKRERISSPRLLAALASVPRENFLAKGPWRIKSEAARSYRLTPSGDPIHLYDNVLVAIDARRKLDRLYGALRDAGAVAPSDAKAPEAFLAALEDDLNTPAALAELFELVRELNKAEQPEDKSRLAAQLRDAAGLLGLLQSTPEAWFAQHAGASGAPEAAEIETLIEQRAAAKKARNFKEADRIRDDLKARGVLIEDSVQGTRWRYVEN